MVVIDTLNISMLEDAVNDAFDREILDLSVLENSEIVQQYRSAYRAIVSEQQGNGENDISVRNK